VLGLVVPQCESICAPARTFLICLSLELASPLKTLNVFSSMLLVCSPPESEYDEKDLFANSSVEFRAATRWGEVPVTGEGLVLMNGERSLSDEEQTAFRKDVTAATLAYIESLWLGLVR
jgi:hypothetical protein